MKLNKCIFIESKRHIRKVNASVIVLKKNFAATRKLKYNEIYDEN